MLAHKPQLACLVDPGASFDTLGNLGVRQHWRYKSFKICFDDFVTVAPPGGFFTFMKMLPNVSFIIKIIKNSVFFSTNSHNFVVSRERHPLEA